MFLADLYRYEDPPEQSYKEWRLNFDRLLAPEYNLTSDFIKSFRDKMKQHGQVATQRIPIVELVFCSTVEFDLKLLLLARSDINAHGNWIDVSKWERYSSVDRIDALHQCVRRIEASGRPGFQLVKTELQQSFHLRILEEHARVAFSEQFRSTDRRKLDGRQLLSSVPEWITFKQQAKDLSSPSAKADMDKYKELGRWFTDFTQGSEVHVLPPNCLKTNLVECAVRFTFVCLD